jgi:hypothetical protein
VSGSLQNGFQQKRSRRLAVRARDAAVGQLLGRALVEVGAQAGERPPSVRHLRPGSIALGRDLRIVADHGHSAGLERGVNVAIAVGALALHSDKAPPWLQAAGIVVNAGDLRVAALEKELRAIEELLEAHC